MANTDNKINIGGDWKNIDGLYSLIDNSWKSVDSAYINTGSEWKLFWSLGTNYGDSFVFTVVTSGINDTL